jgi:diguanylate cyclase (GGDEF)-like protein/PAS domain S-box-containing protein
MDSFGLDEQRRHDTLAAYRVDHADCTTTLYQLLQIAALSCEVPMAAITLAEGSQLRTLLSIGLGLRNRAAAELSFRTVCGGSALIIPDTNRCAFADLNPATPEAGGIRSYVGVPLVSSCGIAYGVLEVMDRVPRGSCAAHLGILEFLAAQITVELESRRESAAPSQLEDGMDRTNDTLVRWHIDAAQAVRVRGLGWWKAMRGEGRLIWSDEACLLHGMSVGAAPDIRQALRAYPRAARKTLIRRVKECMRDGAPFAEEVDAVIGRHRPVRLRLMARAIRGPGGAVTGIQGTVEDTAWTWRWGNGFDHLAALGGTDPAPGGKELDEFIRTCSPDAPSAKRESQEQLQLLQTCVERLNDIVLITDAEPLDHPGPRIVFVNDAFQRRTGYSRDEVIGKTPRILQGPKTQVVELARIGEALRRGKPVRAELINYTKSGDEFWLELDIVPVANAAGKLTHWVAVHRDVTARKRAEAEIQHLAFYDSLTGLPNRRHLLNRLEQALASSHRSQLKGALLFIDLDGFKTLNDTLGHDMGDQLLQQVASRLSACLRQSDTLARLGGDEFVVILENLGSPTDEAASKAGAVCDKILATFHHPFQLDGHEYGSSPSIGVTLFGEQSQNISDLLKRADMAMYQSKAAGRNTVRFFDPRMQAAVTARSALEGDLRHALRRQEFRVHYQPQVNGERHITGVEALVRWQHPQRGMMAPDEFIAVAEETGLIISLGQWVLTTACAQLASWSARPETALLDMAVNVSARQFRHPDFVRQVLEVLDATGANPKQLKLELTENLLVDDMEVTSAKMHQLKTKGVCFSLDDFGTGYSSLSYLKRLPLDQLKLDRLFVRDVLTDPNDASIASTIVKLAKALGLSVIAEGVETVEQRDFLADHDCTTYQGYLFSRPVTVEKLEELIRTANAVDVPGVVPAKPEER